MMTIRSLMLSLSVLAAVPAAAQQPAAEGPTVDGYLCIFAGKCDGAKAPPVTRDAPQTKGFRLARPAAEAANPASNGAVPHAAATVQPGRTARRTARPNYGASSYVAPPAAYAGMSGTAQRPRADLMIGFDLNSARLTADGLRAAQIFAKSLLVPELKSKRFLIEGHTDLVGTREFNMALSRQRAEAVADYLVMLGVSRDRLQSRGYGPDVPLPGHGSNDPQNRRVEAELLS